jgi:hypothetical protein
MKKAIVTYNIGDYEKMPDVLWETEKWDMYCFTDGCCELPKAWTELNILDGRQEKRLNGDFEKNAKRVSNYCKYQPFSLLKDYTGIEYDILIVIDANFQVSNDLDEACERLLLATSDGAFLSHPSVDNCYSDIDLCVSLKKLDLEIGEYTKKIFSEMRVPNKQKYLQTGFSIRRNTSAWQHLEYVWWNDYTAMCNRDQPVFNAILSKYPVLDLTVVYKNEVDPYLNYKKHSFE